jgi:hypothetical protein
MNKEKQSGDCKNYNDHVNEMAKTIYSSLRNDTMSRALASLLYGEGYRKQIEGRWMRNEDHNAYESEYFCSECLADGNNQGNEPFCWNCGAKMKGGE